MTTAEKINAIVNDIENVYHGNRTAKMRAIFETLTSDGITDPRVLRDTAGTALQYNNKGAIYNAWAAWSGRANYVRTNRPAARPTTAPVVTGTDYNAFTFGVELECGFKKNKYATSADAIQALVGMMERFGLEVNNSLDHYNHRDSRTAWKIMTDGSLRADDKTEYMLEIVSPILSGRAGWTQLEIMTLVAEKVGLRVNSTCGTHAHIGVAEESWNTLRNVIVNYSLAFAAYGKVLEESRRRTDWADNYNSSQLGRIRNAGSLDAAARAIGGRYYAVNLQAYARHKTLEFRQHGATLDFRKIQSWVKDKMELVTWSRSNVLEGYTDDVEAMAWHSDDTRANFLMRVFRYAS